MSPMKWNDVLTFWFIQHGPKDWFSVSPELDHEIREKFFEVHQAITRGEAASWHSDIHGRLGEIIVLDQFSRNMFRGTPEAFASDDLALTCSRKIAGDEAFPKLSPEERHMALMPFMHSESQDAHKEALRHFTALENPDALRYEIVHKDIIDRFGRYPHRNAVLNRVSTREEIEFLKTHPGF